MGIDLVLKRKCFDTHQYCMLLKDVDTDESTQTRCGRMRL